MRIQRHLTHYCNRTMAARFVVNYNNDSVGSLFVPVEKACYTQGNDIYWTLPESGNVLQSSGKNTAGGIRFRSFAGTTDEFLVVVGIAAGGEYWGGIAIDLTDHDTASALIPTFYGNGTNNVQNTTWSYGNTFSRTDKAGRKITITRTDKGGGLWAVSVEIA